MGGEADMPERAATEDSRHSDVKSDSPPTVTRKSAPMAKPQSEVTRRPADKSVASNRPSGANAAGPRPGERTPTDLLSTVPAAPPQTASPQSAASSPDADPASGPAAANLPQVFGQSSGFQSTEGFQGGDVLVLTDGAVTRGEGRGRSGAVMSLALELRPPAGTVKREFHFLGSRESSSGSDLDIAYQGGSRPRRPAAPRPGDASRLAVPLPEPGSTPAAVPIPIGRDGTVRKRK